MLTLNTAPICRLAAMLNPKLLDEISARVSALLANTPAADVEKNMRALLSSLFGRLDLVTREEFDVQREVLARTREKLGQLEARVAELRGRAIGGMPVDGGGRVAGDPCQP